MSLTLLSVSNAFSQKVKTATNTPKENQFHRHQIGVIVGNDFGNGGGYLHSGSVHKSIGVGYDFLLNKRQRLIRKQFFGDIEYLVAERVSEPLNKDISANVGIRLLFDRDWIFPLFELSSNTHINVSRERAKIFRSCDSCNNLGFGYGYNAGLGAVFNLKNNMGIAIKGAFSAYSDSILTNAVRSDRYGEVKVFYAF